MPRSINKKEKEVVRLVLEGRSQNQAVLDVYKPKSRKVASIMGVQIFKRPVVQEYMQEMRERMISEISGKVVKGWNEVLDAPTQEKGIKYRDKVSALRYLSDKTVFHEEGKRYNPKQINFISKFLKIGELKKTSPDLANLISDEVK
jgi:hypothetical protein